MDCFVSCLSPPLYLITIYQHYLPPIYFKSSLPAVPTKCAATKKVAFAFLFWTEAPRAMQYQMATSRSGASSSGDVPTPTAPVAAITQQPPADSGHSQNRGDIPQNGQITTSVVEIVKPGQDDDDEQKKRRRKRLDSIYYLFVILALEVP